MAKVTKTEIKVRELMNAGHTPNFAGLNFMADSFKGDYMKALNWIHQAVAPDTLRGELETLLKARRAEADVPFVADLDGVQQQVLGKIAYCLNRGAELDPKSVLRIRTALEAVREKTQVHEVVDATVLKMTPQGRVNEIYKNCYSRLDNLRAMVEAGTLVLKDVHDEAVKILDAQGGTKAQVRKRLVEHYTQSVQEALADKTLKSWVKPLQEILRAVGGDVKAVKEKVAKTEAKAVAKAKTVKEKAVKVAKAVKEKATKQKAVKVAKTKTVTIKPPRAAKASGVPTVAHQVRELIQTHKTNTTEQGMMEIVIKELGLTKERGRSVVKAFWNKVVV
jgi:hypothetical protein